MLFLDKSLFSMFFNIYLIFPFTYNSCATYASFGGGGHIYYQMHYWVEQTDTL